MDFCSSFRASGEKSFSEIKQPQTMFKALRRLHGQNLESKGLNDITEAFQSFVTRARFFSVGKLRRTWSHSAIEFMKYRRLLPMLLADGQRFDSMETDDFDASIAFQATSRDERKITVTNISQRITSSQLQSFFSQFGKVTYCCLPREEKRESMFGTLPKNPKNCGSAIITFRRAEDAERARNATAEQLKLYDQVMIVTAYVSKHRGGKGTVLADDCRDEGSSISRTSSTQSLASTLISSNHEGVSLNDFPSRVLQRIVAYLPIMDTLSVERVNKQWMEASIKSWSLISRITLARDCGGVRGFGKNKPMRNSHIKAILSRAGSQLKHLDFSGMAHFMDGKTLEIISRNCPFLEELDLTGLRASWDSLNEFGEGLPCLQKLAYRDMENVGDKAFWFLIRGSGHSLKFVDFRGCKRLRGRCFRLFGNQLEQLYLDGCSQIDGMAFEDLCTSATALKELRINECFRITDENLSMISRILSDLQVLTLCGDHFENLTITGLSHISRIKTLGELALDYNPLVNDDFLMAIANEIPNLKALSLANAGSDQSLTLRGLLALTKLDKLEQLDLSSLAAIRSNVLLEIVSCCKNLELLQLRNCVYLNDEGVIGLTKSEHIRHIDLSGSILVTNESIQTFIKAFPQELKFSPITIVVGGTAVNASRLSVRGSRVVVDFSDYSALMNFSPSQNADYRIGSKSDDDVSDDEFETLTSQRSFYIDAVCGREDSPIENEKELQEWAEKEAKILGLIKM